MHPLFRPSASQQRCGPFLVARRLCAAIALTLLGASVAACGGDGGAETPDGPAAPTQERKVDDPEHDLIVTPLEAIGATKVEVDTQTVRAHFDGSTQDAVAWTKCSAVEAVSDGRAAVLVYSDGELVCADRDDE